MAPKKAEASTDPVTKDADKAGDGKRFWTPELERKLLMLTLGRTLSAEDYEKILTVFPGTNLNGVKIRTSRLRCERADIFAELGWDLPEGGKGGARRGAKVDAKNAGDDDGKAPAKGRKRSAKDVDGDEKPAPKAKANKKAKGEDVAAIKDEDSA